MINLDASISIPWLVFLLAGQWCLLGLLITLFLAKHLTPRRNPFFVNFILVMFIFTIPPTLLVYTDKQHAKASMSLCFVQSALMDGAAAVLAVAHVILVFDTWSELRSSSLYKSHLSRNPRAEDILLLAPYIVMSIWVLASFAVSFRSKAERYDGFVFCIVTSPAYEPVHLAIGIFLSVAGLFGLFFEIWVCWMIYRYPAKVQKEPLVWRTNIQFAIRVLLYSFLVFIVECLSVANSLLDINSPQIKAAYMMLNSMGPLAAFIIFGSQKSIIKVWTFWKWKKSSNAADEVGLQPQGYPMLDWADVPLRRPAQFAGEHFDREDSALLR